MPLYMTQASFTSEAWASQIQTPQNRPEYMRTLVEANGGTLLGYYYALGEYDAVIIYELPDNVSASALILSAAAGDPASGFNGDYKWTNGTGKYSGIMGDNTFRATLIGKTMEGRGLLKGEWKLPK